MLWYMHKEDLCGLVEEWNLSSSAKRLDDPDIGCSYGASWCCSLNSTSAFLYSVGVISGKLRFCNTRKLQIDNYTKL